MYISGDWKYIAGNTRMIEANWGGPTYPNATTVDDPIGHYSIRCPPQGCLYNIADEPEERHDVSATHPHVVEAMKEQMREEEKGIWNDPQCNKAARKLYGGFYGPWKELEGSVDLEELIYEVLG